MSNFQPENIHRVIVKLSGEILAGKNSSVFEEEVIDRITDDIIEIKRTGYSVGVIVGGGNIFRGSQSKFGQLNRVNADYIGMMGTIQNSLIMSDFIRKKNYHTQVFSALHIEKVADLYVPEMARKSMSSGNICFFSAGTGNPFFTTDTAAVLRAVEVQADIVLKGTKVEGVFTDDPEKNSNASYIAEINYDELLARKLNVMDMTAFSLARDNHVPIKVFNITKKGNLKEALTNRQVGTYIS